MRLFEGTEFDIPPRCDRCQELEEACVCPPEPPPRIDPAKQTAKVRLEKRKRGKMVTLVTGLPAVGNDLPGLLTELKTACGAGGTLKEETLEIQGSHVARVSDSLAASGYRVRTR